MPSVIFLTVNHQPTSHMPRESQFYSACYLITWVACSWYVFISSDIIDNPLLSHYKNSLTDVSWQ